MNPSAGRTRIVRLLVVLTGFAADAAPRGCLHPPALEWLAFTCRIYHPGPGMASEIRRLRRIPDPASITMPVGTAANWASLRKAAEFGWSARRGPHTRPALSPSDPDFRLALPTAGG